MISACFTSWNRTTQLFEAVAPFLDHEFVSEVVISDDFSRLDVYNQVEIFSRSNAKIKLYRNDVNKDCYVNKFLAIQRATNEWCCILDSDNIFSKEYIDRIENLFIAGLNPKTAYQPDFAKPHFNFTHLAGVNLTHQNIHQYAQDDKCLTMLNAANYFVNRDEYMRVFDSSVDPVTSDSIFHNSNWLAAGNSIYVVPGFEYTHQIHEGSHYRVNVNRTPEGFHNSIVDKLRAMR